MTLYIFFLVTLVVLFFGGLVVVCDFIYKSLVILVYELSNQKNHIKPAPGAFLLKISNLLSAEHCKNLRQEVSDMRLEYYDALLMNNIWGAKCVIFFYHTGIGWSLVKWAADRVKEVLTVTTK